MKIETLGRYGKRPTFQAKIGTMSSAEIIVKRARIFREGQRIEFANTKDLRGMSVSATPPWRSGSIWKIEDNRLFISLT